MNDNRMTGQERRATWGLGIVFSLRMLGMFMVLPVLTTYGMALSGASETLIGLAIGIYGLAQAVFQIPFGLLSDRIGRKPLIIFGLIIFTLGSVVAALTSSIWGIILGRALQGSGAIAAAVMALLSDLTREQNRTKAMAFIGVSFGITFAIAMVLGPIITHAFGLHALFWAIALLTIVGIILTLWVVPSPTQHFLNREASMVKGSFATLLTNSKLLKLTFGILCLHILLMSSFVVLPRVMEQAGFAAQRHWQVYLITMLVSFAAVVPAIIYAEVKRHMKQVFIACIMIILLAELVLYQSGNHLAMIIAGIQLFFLAFNLMEALLPSLISKESPAGFKGTAMGIYSTSQFIGVALGGSLGGWVFDHAGSSGVFLVCAAISILWLIVSATMQEPPYLSSLRIPLSNQALAVDLQTLLKQQQGVSDVIVVPEELSAYIKIDTKKTNRQALEALISAI
jgi:MFS family permease